MRVDTLAAGGLAGAAARTLTAPLDRVKILMQTEHLTGGGGPAKYTGLWQSLKRVHAEEGFRGYFRGNLVNCIRVVPYSATQFVTFDYTKRYICSLTGKEQPTVPERLACGALAGCSASFVTHPLDVLRTRLAVQPELRGIAHAAASVWAEGGVVGMYKGLGPALVSLGPFVAINFASYDTIKATFGKENQGPLASLSMGAAAGIIAQTACYPLDTIRRRMQVKGRNYNSTLHALRTIIQQEGVRQLYRGMSANTLKVMPNNAIRFMVFDFLKQSAFFQSLFVRWHPPAHAAPEGIKQKVQP